jgi:hypothetical protein
LRADAVNRLTQVCRLITAPYAGGRAGEFSGHISVFFGVFHQLFQDISPPEEVESVNRADKASRQLIENFIGEMCYLTKGHRVNQAR